MSIFNFFFGRKNKTENLQVQAVIPQEVALTSAPEITSEAEDDFYNLVFYIQNYRKSPAGSHYIQASGYYQGSLVGFSVELVTDWQQIDSPQLLMHAATGYLRSRGEESNTFIQALNAIYNTQLTLDQMKNEVYFPIIALQGNPGNLANEAVNLKLFFEGEEEEDYAECYLNIDLANSRLELNEKDEDYRKPLIVALAI